MIRKAAGSTKWQSRAGELCLDFVNTAQWHASGHPVETLTSFEEFVRWGRRVRLLDRATAEELLGEARRRPAEARAALRRVIVVREILYRVIVALLAGEPPRGRDVVLLNRELRSSLVRVRLAPTSGGFAWTWARDRRRLDWMRWPILDSAADLLTSDRRTRIGQCADDRGCGWLFLDATKNRSRRWCAMDDCGNRAKARRHRERRSEQA